MDCLAPDDDDVVLYDCGGRADHVFEFRSPHAVTRRSAVGDVRAVPLSHLKRPPACANAMLSGSRCPLSLGLAAKGVAGGRTEARPPEFRYSADSAPRL
jgi:hypothetical protein